jgi:hypothetical protein
MLRVPAALLQLRDEHLLFVTLPLKSVPAALVRSPARISCHSHPTLNMALTKCVQDSKR